MTDYNNRPDRKEIKRGNARWKADKKREKEKMKRLRDRTLERREANADPYAPEHGHWVDRRKYEAQRPYTTKFRNDEPAIVIHKKGQGPPPAVRAAQAKFGQVKDAVQGGNPGEGIGSKVARGVKAVAGGGGSGGSGGSGGRNDRNDRDYEQYEDDYERYDEWDLGPTDYANSRTVTESSVTSSSDNTYSTWEPVCDVAETENHWIVRAEMPGVSKDNVSVEVQGDVLFIKGKRDKQEMKKQTTSLAGGEKVTWWSKERGGGKFKREVDLPEKVQDPLKVEAVMKYGVLEVLIPKSSNHPKLSKQGSRVSVKD